MIVLIISTSFITTTNVNAVSDLDTECVKRAYKIGYNITMTHNDTMDALTQLEADCVYSGKLSQEVRCIVWFYDIGIRNADIMETELGYMEFRTEQDLHLHECTNLDQLSS